MEFRDPVCATSHILTAIWAVFAALILYRITQPIRSHRIAVVGYGVSMVCLYTLSAIFHGVPFTLENEPGFYRFFQKLDQSAVFVFIAGTNTPIMAILLRGTWQMASLRGMWGLALCGVASLWVVPDTPYFVIVSLCVAIGILGILPLRHYLRAVPLDNTLWAWTGLAIYAAAALCELLDWPKVSSYPYRIGSHEVFHILVSAASVAFFVFITRHVVGHRSGVRSAPAFQAGLLPANRVLTRPVAPSMAFAE